MSGKMLETWWDRRNAQIRYDMSPPARPLPSDGASWVCYVLHFGVVGLADPQIKVEYVNPIPIMNKYLELNHGKKKVQERE